ncbi:hypothetical protein O1611_g6706 [Lasiodiplodia mahajangana]|uniref:Uncharacterized protein n=1 Tax=Lasiodiplodia mahajangana TaxID=1108764 RepID=A0ACC2JHR7_9PEZI|nr:hypothetical protein O1611_g6706 [Lasiodiplodia mahajangana]
MYHNTAQARAKGVEISKRAVGQGHELDGRAGMAGACSVLGFAQDHYIGGSTVQRGAWWECDRDKVNRGLGKRGVDGHGHAIGTHSA